MAENRIPISRSIGFKIFELLALEGKLDPSMAELRDRYEAGLAHYFEGDWSAARIEFEACRALKPDDKPTRAMLGRLDLISVKEPQSWDGVWQMTNK